MFTELDAINDMLASVGISALTSDSTAHPQYKKAKLKLDLATRQTLRIGWWFNTAVRTLRPNTAGEVILPNGTMHVDPVDTTKNYIQKQRKLYDIDNGTFVIDDEVRCTLITQDAWEDIPGFAQDYIRALARYEYYLDNDGTEPRLSNYNKARIDAWAALYRENLRNVDVNALTSYSARSMARGTGYNVSRPIITPE